MNSKNIESNHAFRYHEMREAQYSRARAVSMRERVSENFS